MKWRRLAFIGIVTLILALTVARARASYCFPGCALYDPWDVEYYIFQCWQCDGPSPQG